MVLRFFFLAFLLISCATPERDNPYDPDRVNSTGGKGKGSEIANYRTVQIGDQIWMAQNLDYNVKGSRCYDNIEANCATYGRYYDWVTAMALPTSCEYNSCASQVGEKHRGICPIGWHIPSEADWSILMKFLNPSCSDNSSCSLAGNMLKATSGWNNTGYGENGTDDYNFTALPGGFCNIYGVFYDLGKYGNWWTSAEYDNNSGAYGRYMSYDSRAVSRGHSAKSILLNVRCIKD